MKETELPRNLRHFGEALRWAMAETETRLERANPDMPRIRITQLSLIEGMEGTRLTPERFKEEQAKGRIYSISSGAISEIFSGISIPKDPRTFLQSACRVLGIKENTPEYNFLIGHLGKSVM